MHLLLALSQSSSQIHDSKVQQSPSESLRYVSLHRISHYARGGRDKERKRENLEYERVRILQARGIHMTNYYS